MGNGHHRLEQRFAAYDDEKLYGLGQHQHGKLDQKGLVLDLVQRNAEVGIPVLASSRGYTLLWNNPAIGRVELARNGTRWVADSARQIDYWITAGTPADGQRRYSGVTGRTPMLPEWAAGFWQCKLRYRTQDELLAVAREYKRRGLPVSAIVCDFFHWTHLGEWKFDPAEWPDPAAMVRELEELGIKLVVSVWPSVSPLSENHPVMEQRGYFIGTQYGPMAHADWPDKGVASTVQVAFYDATNPEAREFMWSKVRDNYLAPYGITAFWLDACEPELKPGFQENLRYWAGPGLEVGNMYPAENSRTFHEGLTAHAARRSSPSTARRGRAVSATAPPCGPVTSALTSRPCVSRSPRVSTPRCPASRGGTRTSAASTAATRTTRRTARSWSAGSSSARCPRSCACTASATRACRWDRR